MLIPRAIALQGIGYSPALIALQGLLAVQDQPVNPLPPQPTGGFYADGTRARRRRKDDEEALLLNIL